MSTAAIVAIATFLLVFAVVCAGALMMRSQRGHGGAELPLHVRRRSSTVTVAVAVAVTGILSFFILIGIARLSLSLFEPFLAWLAAQFWAVFFKPYGAFVLGFVVLVAGLPFSNRFRRPSRFRTGVVLVAAALVTFWPLQYGVGLFDFRFWEWEAILHVVAFFFSVSLLGAGLESMRRANNTPEADSWEFL